MCGRDMEGELQVDWGPPQPQALTARGQVILKVTGRQRIYKTKLGV